MISPDWLVSTRIDAGACWRTAWQAAACHRSQLPNYADLASMPVDQQRRLWGINEYGRLYSTVPVATGREDDLFAGLRGTATDRLTEAA